MHRTLSAIFIGLTLCLQASSVLALGFGRSSNATLLGQPLDYSVLLTAEPGEVFTLDCVAAEVQSGDNKLAAGAVGLHLDAPAAGGATLLRIFTNVRIEEPVVSVTVAVGCPPRLSRKFVAFVDPPVLVLGPSVPGAEGSNTASSQAGPMAVPERRSVTTPIQARPVPRPAPTPEIIAARALRREQQQAARAAARAARAAREPAVAVARPSLSAASATKTSARVNVANSGGGGAARDTAVPRLRLETAQSPTTTSSSREAPAGSAAPMAPADKAALEAAVAAGASDAERELRDLERQRVQKLEDNFNRLMVESKATQQSLTLLQARLREAEESRYANPLVYALLALVVLLLAAVALLFWRQSRMKREPAWWDSSMAETGHGPVDPAGPAGPPLAAAAGTGMSPGTSTGAVPAPMLPDPGPPTFPAGLLPVTELRMLSTPAPTPPDLESLNSFTVEPDVPSPSPYFDSSVFNAPSDGAATHELSVEELIDLEQQAEFFIVLGQDSAAIDLLMGHVRSSGGTSPMPYMKLLEIYRRRGERDPYERIREGFNRRFNAFAPEWEADPSSGRSLEGYPAVMERIQQVWATPGEAVTLLESLLFRREAGDSTFDLPAFGELLFLYSQARDSADHPDSDDDVDLLLPLDMEPMVASPSPSPTPSPNAPSPNDAAARHVRSSFGDDASSVDFELVDLSQLPELPEPRPKT